MDNKSKKSNSRKKKIWLLYALMGICIVAVIVFAVLLGTDLYTNWQSQSYYSNLSDGIETRPRPTGGPRPTQGATDSGDDTGEEAPDVQEIIWEPYVDFEALNERFPGVVGWIKLDGTPIDYPIMQYTDNDFFLDRLPDGTSHRSGSIFLDYSNNPDFSDRVIALYGHAMRTQDMFGSLKNFREQKFYEEHPVAHIYTPTADYELVLIAGYRVPASEPPPFTFGDDEAFLRHIESIKRRSSENYFVSDVEVGPDDRIVNLCTCTYEFENARLIIVGKLVVISEPH